MNVALEQLKSGLRSAAAGRRRHWVLAGVGLVSAVLMVAVAAVHNVSVEPTPEDRAAAEAILSRNGASVVLSRPATFAEEIDLILAVQAAVLDAAPVDEEIPQGQAREPQDLLTHGKGLCFDRSRAIEKMLKLAGLETRHIAVYSTRETGSALVSLATPQVSSHAVSEVRTSRGWIVVDSNDRWIGLSQAGEPYSMAEIRGRNEPVRWSERVPATINGIFEAPFTWLYGLYSRHGMFYPPYTPVPDVNWGEFAANLPLASR